MSQITKGKIAILISELYTEDQFLPELSNWPFSPETSKLSFLGQIGPCVDVVLYISTRQMLNVPFTLSSCWSNIYVLI
jgi:hypothetical protein